MLRRSFIFGLMGSVALGGCAPQLASYQADAMAASLQAPYTLASGDKLRIIVFGQDSLSNVYAVDGAGRISMPLIGAVEARHLTTAQLERAIETRLRAGFLREPRVSVEVDQFRPFFILGEVTQAGQYPFVNGMSVQTAVAIAGGYSPRASQSYAEISRMHNGQIVKGDVPPTFPVRPGDTIIIKERFF